MDDRLLGRQEVYVGDSVFITTDAAIKVIDEEVLVLFGTEHSLESEIGQRINPGGFGKEKNDMGKSKHFIGQQ